MTMIRFNYTDSYANPSRGSLAFMPHRRHAANETEILPKPFTVPLLNGEVTVDLEPNTESWVWIVTEHFGQDSTSGYYTIPEQDGVIEHTELIQISPSSLPAAYNAVEPVWWATMRQYKTAVVDNLLQSGVAIERAETAVEVSETAVEDSQRNQSLALAYRNESRQHSYDSRDYRNESRDARDKAEEYRDDALYGPNNAADRSEEARDESRIARDESVTAQQASEVARDESQSARDESQSARDESVTARDESVTARDESQSARDDSVTAQQAAESARDEATTGPNNAADRAQAAATQAEAALDDAEAARDAASTSADRAQTAADTIASATWSQPTMLNGYESNTNEFTHTIKTRHTPFGLQIVGTIRITNATDQRIFNIDTPPTRNMDQTVTTDTGTTKITVNRLGYVQLTAYDELDTNNITINTIVPLD